MPSSLSFPSTQQFRTVLMARNLSPYTVPSVYTSPGTSTIVHETVLRDEGVFDSPDNLIADDPFADILYPLNAYGPAGGYDKTINVGGLANTQSNLGFDNQLKLSYKGKKDEILKYIEAGNINYTTRSTCYEYMSS